MIGENCPDWYCITGPRYKASAGGAINNAEPSGMDDYCADLGIKPHILYEMIRVHGIKKSGADWDYDELDDLVDKHGPPQGYLTVVEARRIAGGRLKHAKPAWTCGNARMYAPDDVREAAGMDDPAIDRAPQRQAMSRAMKQWWASKPTHP